LLRDGTQGESLADGRKTASCFSRDIMLDPHDLHLCFDPRIGSRVHWRKNDVDLDRRIHWWAYSGQDKNTHHTDVPGDSITLEMTAPRILPPKNYRSLHSITNGSPAFSRIFICSCDVRVSASPGSARNSQSTGDYVLWRLSASGLLSCAGEDYLVELMPSSPACPTTQSRGDPT
jgi:hypothetical protein